MTTGRYNRVLANAACFDQPFNALPGLDQDDEFARSNIPVHACTSDLAAISTSVAVGVRIWLRKGDVVTYVAFVAGNTAENTPTHRAHALYDPDGALLAQSADQLTAAWAVNTKLKLALSAPVTIEEDGWYIAATTTTATTTVQTLIGCAPIVTAAGAAGGLAPGFTFGSALAGVFPATTGALTAVAKVPIAILT